MNLGIRRKRWKVEASTQRLKKREPWRFDQPEKYKPFVSRYVVQGNLEIGSLREVDVKSGLPATTSTERLELLDDDEHILSVRIVGGDHRLNFRGMLRGSSNGSQWGLDYLY
ncbi:hypothetical protein LguiA_029677 [Lonicera macranthoides]